MATSSTYYPCCSTTFTGANPEQMHADYHNIQFERGRRAERIELPAEQSTEQPHPLDGHTRIVTAQARNGAVLCSAVADTRTIRQAVRALIANMQNTPIEYADLYNGEGELIAEYRPGRGGLHYYGAYRTR